MAELFGNNFSDFKFFTGGRLNTSLDLKSIESTIYEAARRHVVPWLSLSEYNTLVTAAAGSPSIAQTALLPYVKRAVAVLTMYEWSKVAGVQLSDSGFHRVETDNRKSAYRYQEKAYQEDSREKGYEALEEMLVFLTNNAGTYTDWAATEEAARHRECLLNYSSTFRLLTDHAVDRYTYEAMRPIIVAVEEFGVEKLLPVTFWTGFKSRYVAGTLTVAEKAVLKLMRKAIAFKSIEEAKAQHLVVARSGRVYVSDEFGEQNQVNRTTPAAGLLSASQRDQLWADRYTCAWKQYIIDNKSSFPTVFDVASGGTNTSTDAWHINTEDEQTEADQSTHKLKSGPTFIM